MNKKIKIIFALPSFAVGGGIEKQLLEQLHFYPAEKYEIHLISLFYVTDRPHLYERLPFHVKSHILNFKGYFDFLNFFSLFKAIKNINPGVAITSMFPANAVFRIFKPFFNYKIITREHNTYTDKTFFHNIVEKILSPLSDKIVAVSEGVADFFARQTGIKREKIMVINNGIDLSKIAAQKEKFGNAAETKKELGFSPEDKIILNVARLKPQKNHSLLLKSFKKFSESRSDYKLAILGIGSEKERLAGEIRDLNLGGRVFLMGYRDDVNKFYFISDMFVLTSEREGFPNVLLEAMAFGVPAITTEVGGVKEMIREGENGFVVNPDSDEIAAKMETIAKNPERYKKFCEDSARDFDIREIVAKYEELINTLT